MACDETEATAAPTGWRNRIAGGGVGESGRPPTPCCGRNVAVKTLHSDRAGDPDFSAFHS
jgi:hypothetical protein